MREDSWEERERSRANYATHTIKQPKDCDCSSDRYCNICDGGLAFCTVCKGGEIELEEQSCEERMAAREVCGCGKPTRYMVADGSGYACNKYFRCKQKQETGNEQNTDRPNQLCREDT